jgi:hypothetical protein
MPRRRGFKVPVQEYVVPSAARTGNGTGSTLSTWNRGAHAVAKLTVTAASGTPTLTVFVEDSPNGIGWTVRDTFGAKTGISTETRTLPTSLADFQRVRWTITGGTPNITFDVQFAAGTLQLA